MVVGGTPAIDGFWAGKNRDLNMLELTDEIILKDIEEFKARIHRAECKLDKLPQGYLPIKEYKKRERKRRALNADVTHLKLLIGYALEGIELSQQETRCCY